MADAIDKLEILLSPEVDKSAIAKVNKQFESLRNTFSNILAENKGKSPLSKEMKAVEKEYKKTLSAVKRIYGVEDKSAKAIIRDKLSGDKSIKLPLKIAEQSVALKKTKQWTPKQLLAKSSDFDFWEKQYQKQGYKGATLTRKINAAMGTPGGYQAYKKNKEEIKLLKEKNKAEKKSIPFLKEMAKLGGIDLSPLSKLGIIGGTAYLAGKGLYSVGKEAYGNTILKDTFEGYSKALAETFNKYKVNEDVLQKLYGQWYGFKERARVGDIDYGTITKLATYGSSELANKALFGSTNDFILEALRVASNKKNDAEALNLLTRGIGMPAEDAMQLVKKYRSGEFQSYYASRLPFENVGTRTGQALRGTQESIRGLTTQATNAALYGSDTILTMRDQKKSFLGSALDWLGGNKADLVSQINGTNGGNAITVNNNITNNLDGGNRDQVDNAARLTRMETNINLKNAQVVQ